jgi:hypothetical protein
LQVLNAFNIQVTGTATELPTTVGPPVAALTTATNAAGSAVRTEAPTQNAGSDAASVIIVEFLGFGGGDNDVETPAQPQSDKQHRSEIERQYDPNSSFKLLGNGALTREQESKLTGEERSKLRALERGNAL